MARICVFGNSIIWGADDLIKGGWVDRFKIYFKKTGKFNEVFNLGIPGNASTLLLKRIENECKARLKIELKNGNIVIIQTGINDSVFFQNEKDLEISPERFRENIQKLINVAQTFSSKIVFVGLSPVEESKTNPIPWDTNKSYKNEHIKKYNEIIKSVCEENKIYFIEIFDNWMKSDYKKLLEDGLHPNSEGHQKIFELVKSFLIKNNIIT